MADRFPFTLTQLSYFVECARTLNMTAASQELHVAQSAVSTAITHLERALGSALFIRQHSKGLILTSAGETLLRDARGIFDALNDTVESIRADQEEVRGTITVACFSTLAPFVLPLLLGRLQRRHPELEVATIESDHEGTVAALRGGRAEVAINYVFTEEEGIEHRVVGEFPPHALVHADHPLAGRGRASLLELADDSFVLLDLPSSRDYFLGILRQLGVTPRLRYRSSSYETVRSMVATGLGYSLLNQRPRIEDTYTGEQAVALEITDPVPSLRIAVSRLRQAHPTARASAVERELRELIAEAQTAP
ncbi:LysR substrate-binding domain-containing protein [Leucobacter massiliensis]|uniref:LysR family transcriptional regulator n=1 Tax=Leucobacter massiliensis TaxID=1686285 RepID=A0A2S9QP55_9MICO|nr:LysR substrate-binding domain-containing protein [Leucobacter massiliensis]PRI11366.1 LysR family transcriptional regulator [Leucobacter massiliensis]